MEKVFSPDVVAIVFENAISAKVTIFEQSLKYTYLFQQINGYH